MLVDVKCRVPPRTLGALCSINRSYEGFSSWALQATSRITSIVTGRFQAFPGRTLNVSGKLDIVVQLDEVQPVIDVLAVYEEALGKKKVCHVSLQDGTLLSIPTAHIRSFR